ncbi:MAG TPA: thiamine phosphate synthase [Chthoniobacterales bacterium]|jgi:thiamine-phosphate pyrophosphorylase|nr:thiamine phosphate synthase [Chthoniobacterales bacterium]
MKHLSDCRLYGIVDLGYVDVGNVAPVARAMITGGVDVIQLRAKQQSIEEIVQIAICLYEITAPSSVPLIVNDHAGVAREVRVEGVHVGQADDSVALARRKAERPIIVGKSTHSLEQATAAQSEGADYIGFGPIFATPTKPDYEPIGLNDIREAHDKIAIPIFCIGGIKLDNLPEVIAAGAKRVVIVSGILQAADTAEYTHAAKAMLTGHLSPTTDSS